MVCLGSGVVVGWSFGGDGVSEIGCGEGMVGGSYWAPLHRVTALIFSLRFCLACEGSLLIFRVSILLNDVTICPVVFSKFLNEA